MHPHSSLRCAITMALLAAQLAACGDVVENPPIGEGEGQFPTGPAFETYIQDVMTKRQIPGITIAVLDRSGPVYKRAFGYRGLKEKQPVTLRTHFAVGSVTKAFTATLAGMFVDAGTVRWDDPLRTYDPSFTLSDEAAAAQIDLRDCLCHRTGIGRNDELWESDHLSREEIYAKIQTVPLTNPFRSTFEYNNNMYMVAGYLYSRAAGDTWENLMLSRLLRPLGMNEATVSADGLAAQPDHAIPHRTNAVGRLSEQDIFNSDDIAPAGSISTNVLELIRWLEFQRAGGVTSDGRRLITQASFDETHKPNILVEAQNNPAIGDAHYGMGWLLLPYREHRIITHDGQVNGYQAHVSFMPDDGFAVVILMNSNGMHAQWLGFDVYDQLLNVPPVQWSMIDGLQ